MCCIGPLKPPLEFVHRPHTRLAKSRVLRRQDSNLNSQNQNLMCCRLHHDGRATADDEYEHEHRHGHQHPEHHIPADHHRNDPSRPLTR